MHRWVSSGTAIAAAGEGLSTMESLKRAPVEGEASSSCATCKSLYTTQYCSTRTARSLYSVEQRHATVCMYVYICMYACMYVCMHVCIYIAIHLTDRARAARQSVTASPSSWRTAPALRKVPTPIHPSIRLIKGERQADRQAGREGGREGRAGGRE